MDHWIARAAALRGESDAIGHVSYDSLHGAALRAAGALRRKGVAPGDQVALALPAGAEFVAALHGCFLAGAIAVPIDLRLSKTERTARTAPAAMVVDSPLDGPPLEAPVELTLDRVAVVMYTSGTTGAPRPVALTFANWLASALSSAVALGLDPGEKWLCPMPLVHVGGLSIPIRSAIYATTAVLYERFDADAVTAALMDAAERITLVSVVPTMLVRLLDAGLRDPPALRWALLGGGPIPPPLLERAREAEVPVAPTYGMTEACSQIATHGWPLLGMELRTAADGELLVRGPAVAPGALSADGWLRTGDLATLDHRGLRITGRKAEVIVTGGENVSPQEVEAALLAHPAVADACVFGRPDPEWGEALVAAVVLRDGSAVEAGELRAFCAERLARFKVPKEVRFTERLPRGATGKLLRRELR